MLRKQILRVFWFLAVVCGWQPAIAVEEDVYEEGGTRPYVNLRGEWKEQDIVLPPYPSASGLFEVDLGLSDFDFKLLIDPESLSVGEDRVVRFTTVLRSAKGVDNVSYEGLRCDRKMYRRYAYGSDGAFHQVHGSEWRYISVVGLSRYRAALVKDFVCPLPMRDKRPQLLKKLKSPNPKQFFYDSE